MSTNAPQSVSMNEAIRSTHGPSIAVQGMITVIQLTPHLDFESVKTKVEPELQKLTPDVAAAAVQALDDIDTHTGGALDHGNDWVTEVLPKLDQTADDVSGYADEFDHVAGPVLQAIEDLGPAPTPDEQKAVLEKAKSKLTALQPPVAERARNAGKLSEALDGVSEDAQRDKSCFEQDRQAVDNAITGGHGAITAIGDRVTQLNSELAEDAAKIAKGEVDVIPGICLIAIGGAFTLDGEPEIGLNFITAGIGLLPPSGTTISQKDLDEEKAELAQDLEELTLLQSAISCFGTTQSAVTQFAGSTSVSAEGAHALKNAWDAYGDALKSNLKSVKDALDGLAHFTETITGLRQFLRFTTEDWADAKKTAETVKAALSGVATDPDVSRVDWGTSMAVGAPGAMMEDFDSAVSHAEATVRNYCVAVNPDDQVAKDFLETSLRCDGTSWLCDGTRWIRDTCHALGDIPFAQLIKDSNIDDITSRLKPVCDNFDLDNPNAKLILFNDYVREFTQTRTALKGEQPADQYKEAWQDCCDASDNVSTRLDKLKPAVPQLGASVQEALSLAQEGDGDDAIDQWHKVLNYAAQLTDMP
ncbi:HBL/NHE enterotoxin family protein [Streptomyces sp. NPDC059009]|uniref:HBL/NHE enterotoxin family protein n=1 Tax=Streptomyces sp. NPDC059009 TaxID=3346694 RepID=UPI00368C53BD